MGGNDAAKAPDSKSNTFFLDYAPGGLGLSGTGEGGGGKGQGVSAMGPLKIGPGKAYQSSSFSDKGLSDKKFARSNQQFGDEWRAKHPGSGLASLYAGDLGSQGGLTLSDPKKKGGTEEGKGPGNKLPGGGTIVRSSYNPKTGWQPVMKGDKPAAKVDAPKQPIVPPSDMRRAYDPPKAPLGTIGGIGKDEDASAWDKPKTWKAPNGQTYSWGDPMASFDGQDVPKGW